MSSTVMIMSPACYWCCDAKEASTHSSAASGDSLKPFCPYTFGADRSSLRRIILIYQKNGSLLQKHFTISCGGGVTVSHQLLSFARLRIRGEKSCFFYVSTGSFLIILVFSLSETTPLPILLCCFFFLFCLYMAVSV